MSGTPLVAKRTFEDVTTAIANMTGRRPNRSTNNLLLTQRLAAGLGLQPALDRLKFVHVAGTKGKGSTSAYCSRILRDAYQKNVGLFLSPHLVDVRERVQINNQLIPKDRFTEYFFHIHDRISEIAANGESEMDREGASRSNFFRFMFLLALYAFEKEGMEFAILEVGIGGRIDATNIIQKPAVCGITTLGMDHMELLGDTVELIAGEKAGIIKPGVPCLSAPQSLHPTTRAVLQKVAETQDAPLLFMCDEVLPRGTARFWPTLRMGGDHFIENSKLGLALARAAVGVPIINPLTPTEIEALEKTSIEGRSEIIPLLSGGTTGDVTAPEADERLMSEVAASNYSCIGGGQRVFNPLFLSRQQRVEEEIGNDSAAAQHKGASTTLSCFGGKFSLYLDGAHNAESMAVMSEWFFEFEKKKKMKKSGSGGKLLSSPSSAENGTTSGSENNTAVVHNTILFYCTREPKDMLRYFMPYTKDISRIIFCLIPNPKSVAASHKSKNGNSGVVQNEDEGVDGAGRVAAAVEDMEAQATFVEAWRQLYREVPCFTCPVPFRSTADIVAAVLATGDAATDTRQEGETELEVENRVLVTGSVLFVGEILKLVHADGYYDVNNMPPKSL